MDCGPTFHLTLVGAIHESAAYCCHSPYQPTLEVAFFLQRGGGGVTDGARTRDLRSHNPMPPVLALTGASGYPAHLRGLRRLCRTRSSAAYRSVPSRLQYGPQGGESGPAWHSAWRIFMHAAHMLRSGLGRSGAGGLYLVALLEFMQESAVSGNHMARKRCPGSLDVQLQPCQACIHALGNASSAMIPSPSPGNITAIFLRSHPGCT